MPTSKKKSRPVKRAPDPRRFFLTWFLILSLILNFALVLGIWKELLISSHQQQRQLALNATPNRACSWLDLQHAQAQLGTQFTTVNARGVYTGKFKEQGVRYPVARHNCVAAARQGSISVTASYFGSEAQAQDYAAKIVNPERSWSEGAPHEDRQGIFSFVIISNGGRGSSERVEAYTVKETTVLRFSIPCSGGLSGDPGKCDAAAISVVRSVLDSAQNNRDKLPINPLVH